MHFLNSYHIANILFLLKITTTTCDSGKVKYYSNLITETREKIKSYKLPTSNQEFTAGCQSENIIEHGSYDFIVIGAGTAGSVMVKRLSESQKWRILVVEAGGHENDYTDIPLYSLSSEYTPLNWGYLTVPQNNSCLGMVERRCVSPRGKVLGGSNTINGMAYVRGNPNDFDNWAKEGNTGWSFKDILPYFKKSENSQIKGQEGYHGQNGIWNVEYPEPLAKTYANFIEAHKELNHSYIDDYNGDKQIGCSRIQYAEVHGKRLTTAKSFLTYADRKDTVTVATNSLVTKIIIDSAKTAKGIIFVHDNKKYRVYATKEVILSGGAINSPQLLMLSGIGPRQHLQEKGISPVVADLPVGQNLIEHPYFLGLRFKINYTEPNYSLDEQVRQYLNGVGPLTFSFNMHGLGFLAPKKGRQDVPITEYIYAPANSTVDQYGKFFNFNEEITRSYANRLDPLTTISFYLFLLHEKSRGSITLKSNSPLDFPNIDFNMFSDKNNEDIDNMIDAIDFIMKLINTKPFKKLNATFIELPVCNNYEKFSRKYWECALRQMSSTIYHPTGTTKMGPRENGGVVDSNLKVYDVKNLRVVDAGVMPNSLSGHTNAATAMIAEKASDLIKQEHGESIHQCSNKK